MHVTFHHGFDIRTGELFDWTITNEAISYKGKRIPLNKVSTFSYTKPKTSNTFTSNGSFIFYMGRGYTNVVLTYSQEEQDKAQIVIDFLTERLGEEHAADVDEEGAMSSKLQSVKKAERRKVRSILAGLCIFIIVVGSILGVVIHKNYSARKKEVTKKDVVEIFNKDPDDWTDSDIKDLDSYFGKN